VSCPTTSSANTAFLGEHHIADPNDPCRAQVDARWAARQSQESSRSPTASDLLGIRTLGPQSLQHAFERVAVAVVVLTVEAGALHAALYQRQLDPDPGTWALPGGFVNMDESLEQAAARVLATKVGLANVFLEQLFTFGDVQRFSRSADFQDVHVNAVVTWRVTDPDLLPQRVDFSLDTKTGRFNSEPLDKLAGVVVQLAQQLVVGFLARHPLSPKNSTPSSTSRVK